MQMEEEVRRAVTRMSLGNGGGLGTSAGSTHLKPTNGALATVATTRALPCETDR